MLNNVGISFNHSPYQEDVYTVTPCTVSFQQTNKQFFAFTPIIMRIEDHLHSAALPAGCC